MSRSEFRPDDSHPDLTRLLEENLLAGFPLDLALDLVLNELVVRAAEATRASAAALALARGDEMVCRAATGHLAPDLGVPLNPRDGLSGACLQTRQPQLSVDTEFDPRVDPAISRRLGIRSILIVPIFDMNNAQFTGVLEVFSSSPAAFSNSDQKLLEGFAEECARIRQVAIERSQRKPAAALVSPKLVPPPNVVPSDFVPPELIAPDSAPPGFSAPNPKPARRASSEVWTLVLGSLAILATIVVSFLIGSRIGWLRHTSSHAQTSHPIPAETSMPRAQAKSCVGTAAPGCPAEQSSATTPEKTSAKKSTRTSATPAATRSSTQAEDELVVYEKGKVIFRMRPAPAKPDQAKRDQAQGGPTKPASIKQDGNALVEASSTTKIAATKIATTKIATTKSTPTKTPAKTASNKSAQAQSVWLAPAQAESRLLSRTEPQYPHEALAAHRAGNVVLEVQVAEDGSVSNIRTLSGDPLLAAAATAAVRTWRYHPYRQHDHPAQFQTDVTLSFALPN
jgi:TonB family protein